jgi:hypothetical protein
MNALDKLLKEQGIKPSKKEHALDDKFDSPMDQLDDLFESFARIFAPRPFHQDRFNNYKNSEDE